MNNVHGILLLDKPLGLSSNNALQKVKRIYQAKKAGHTGTLDPLATGLLPICFGEATKFSSYLLNEDKEYIANIKLGVTTNTFDSEGEVTSQKTVLSSEAEIKKVVYSFLGTIDQTPPIYSALKVSGRPLYSYARAKEDVTIKSRQVHIYELEILDYKKNEIVVRVKCTKGTYIRSFANDIGQRLGCGAHLTGLIRTKIGSLTIANSIKLEKLNLMQEEKMLELLPVDILVKTLARYDINEKQYNKIKYGHKFEYSSMQQSIAPFNLYYNNLFLGVATINDNYVKPIRLISNI